MSNETLQQVMRDMLKMTLATYEGEKAKASERKVLAEKDGDEASSEDSKFEDLYGEGFTLAREPPTESTTTDRIIK